MIDLSHLAANGPWITSQAAGGNASNAGAFSGPGTPPADPLPDREHQSGPTVTPIAKPRSVLVDGHDSPSPVPWTASDGSRWRSASDGEYLPARMMLARGSWNEV